MKNLLIVAAAAVLSATAFAADADAATTAATAGETAAAPAAKTDAARPKPRRRPPKGRGGKPSGGIVEKAYSGKVFRVLNAQTDAAGEKFAAQTKHIRHTLLLPVECVQEKLPEGQCPFEAAEKLVAQPGVGAGAVIVSDAKLPMLTVSPDRRWGILNVAPLKADNPTPEKFAERFNKAYWNVVGRTLGAGNSSYPGCVLMPFSNMRQLDAITATRPCPEPFNKMIDTGAAWGIGIISIASYRTACQQGWAAAPTNDVQKAIWDEVHAMPKNPMKIEFDQKKGK